MGWRGSGDTVGSVSPSKPEPKDAATRGRLLRQRSRDTKAELQVRRELHSRGLRYRVDRRPIRSSKARADVVFGPARVAVFVDGCFWHGCPEHFTKPKNNAEWWQDKIETNRARDRQTAESLDAAGWLALRYWEHEDPADVAAAVEAAVRERRS